MDEQKVSRREREFQEKLARAEAEQKKAKRRGKGKSKPKAQPQTHKNGLPKGPGKRPCACGCGGTTNSVFQQGHDAKVYSVLRKIASKQAKVSDLPEAVRTNKQLLARMRSKVH